MHGYYQARKVEDTPFPFPYAQMVTVMLALMVFVVPLVAVSKLGRDHTRRRPASPRECLGTFEELSRPRPPRRRPGELRHRQALSADRPRAMD